jgi:2'-5' RNA ligase
VRVFVALDIPEDVRAAIGALIARLRTVCRAARWARIEGIHLTQEEIETIKASLARIRFPNPIEMKFRNVGFFPNERRPTVFWAGIEAGAELGALAAAVETALEPLGVAKERRTFSPHLTLARLKPPDGSALKLLREAISTAGPLEFGAGVAKEFHLYQSILRPSGAEYTRLVTFRFAGGESL